VEEMMAREERINEILAQGAVLKKQMQNAPEAALQRQLNALKSKLNLFGPAAMERWMRQVEFAEAFDEVAAQEKQRAQRWAKNPVMEKIKKLAETGTL
jgi:hypothetical protein